MELDMTKGTPWKLMLRFIYPIILGNIFQQFYTMVDTAIVGRMLGVSALAAVGATGTICFLILGFTQGMCAGFTVITAQRFGAGDYEAMRKSIAISLVLGAIVTVVMSIGSCRGMRALLKLMNTPDDIFEMSYSYIVVICGFMFCTIFYNLLASILRAIGNSKVPLFFLILSALLNIALDILMIPRLGVAGAAWATVVSQGISAFLCLIYIMKKVPLLHLKKEHWRWDWSVAGYELKIGIPMALETSITAMGTMIVQAALNLFGSTIVAAYASAVKFQQILTAPMFAMGTTSATYSAQNRGINAVDRIRQGAKSALIILCIYSIIIYGVQWFTMPLAIKVFVSENVAEVTKYAQIYGVVTGAFFIPLSLIFIFRNLIQGCGFATVAIVGGILEMVGRVLTARYAQAVNSYEGVCAADSAAWLMAGVFLFVSYFFIVKKMEREKSGGDKEKLS